MRTHVTRDMADVWINMPQYAKKLHIAEDIIKNVLQMVEKPYVSFSCGKDSEVLAHMVIQHNPSVPLRFFSGGETRLLHNVDDIISHFKELGATVEEIHVDRVFSGEYADKTWEEQLKLGNDDLRALNTGEYDCVFLGLRKEESRRRAITLSHHNIQGFPAYTYRYADSSKYMRGMVRCCPLADWRTIDIAAYLTANNIPILKWYDSFGFESRTTARVRKNAVRQNIVADLRKSNPSGYAALYKRFPELRVYI